MLSIQLVDGEHSLASFWISNTLIQTSCTHENRVSVIVRDIIAFHLLVNDALEAMNASMSSSLDELTYLVLLDKLVLQFKVLQNHCNIKTGHNIFVIACWMSILVQCTHVRIMTLTSGKCEISTSDDGSIDCWEIGLTFHGIVKEILMIHHISFVPECKHVDYSLSKFHLYRSRIRMIVLVRWYTIGKSDTSLPLSVSDTTAKMCHIAIQSH